MTTTSLSLFIEYYNFVIILIFFDRNSEIRLNIK